MNLGLVDGLLVQALWIMRGDVNQCVYVFRTEKEVGNVEEAHENMVWSLAWHPLGHILVSGSNDHTTCVPHSSNIKSTQSIFVFSLNITGTHNVFCYIHGHASHICFS